MIKAQSAGFLHTPPLWKGKQFDIQQFEFPALALGDFQPNAIPMNLRLGHQMEYVFQQLINYSKAYKILIYNLPISDEKRTLGEIDFILKNKASENAGHSFSDKLIHVELTYKFYIIDSDLSDPIRSLIGPNRKDQFFAKMQKIKTEQFPLLHSEAGVKALAVRNIDHLDLEHQCCFKAQLFRPYESSIVNIGALNKDCLAGYWMRFDKFKASEFVNAEFYIPNKSEWAVQPHEEVLWRDHEEILEEIDPILVVERAPMVWMRRTGVEIVKLFVVWW